MRWEASRHCETRLGDAKSVGAETREALAVDKVRDQFGIYFESGAYSVE